MARRERTIDRELLIFLIVFVVLATASRVTGHGERFEVFTETPPPIAQSMPHSYLLDAPANPYWAPAHAFTRRPTPLYSSDTAPTVHDATVHDATVHDATVHDATVHDATVHQSQ